MPAPPVPGFLTPAVAEVAEPVRHATAKQASLSGHAGPAGPSGPSGTSGPSASPKAVARATGANTSAPGSYRRDDRKQGAQARSQIANRTRPLRNEVAQIDARLTTLGAERAQLESLMAAGHQAAPDIAETGRRLNHINAELGQLEERWLVVQTEIETLTADGAA